MLFERYHGNPIVLPGEPSWRRVVSFNPGVVRDVDGRFWMLERAVSSLAPLYSHVGLLVSDDGFHYRLASEEPVFTAAMLGTPRGTVEDPRVVRHDDAYYMTYVHRNYASSCFPNGVGVPDYHDAVDVPPGDPNHYRSGIARSPDLRRWEDLGLVTAPEVDDRDCVLFPERIGGRYAMLRRPLHFVGPDYGCERPSIWISQADDLSAWSEPKLVATVERPWEGVKIGAGAAPLPTEEGWLLIYHGVDDAANYRTGLMLLDREDPSRVLARTPEPVFQPEAPYERVGLIIPRVVFPSANVIADDTVLMYYGCCDTCIGVATAPLAALLDHLRHHRIAA